MLFLSILISIWAFKQMTNGELINKIVGFGILKVESGSMEPSISVGDILIIKECREYDVNDIVTYNVDNNYLVTHRIIRKENEQLVTKGDNNNTEDSKKIRKENIEGKVILNSKLLKCLYNHWQIMILIVFIILIVW